MCVHACVRACVHACVVKPVFLPFGVQWATRVTVIGLCVCVCVYFCQYMSIRRLFLHCRLQWGLWPISTASVLHWNGCVRAWETGCVADQATWPNLSTGIFAHAYYIPISTSMSTINQIWATLWIPIIMPCLNWSNKHNKSFKTDFL